MYIHSPNIKNVLALAAALVLFTGCGSTDSNSDESNSSITFNSGTIATGETFSYTFEQEGTVEYYCELHAPDMQGQITVSSSENSATRDTVMMTDNDTFVPSSLEIASGTEVVWINNADHDHTVLTGNPASGGGGPDY